MVVGSQVVEIKKRNVAEKHSTKLDESQEILEAKRCTQIIVGGWLNNATSISVFQRNPMLLPATSYLTT